MYLTKLTRPIASNRWRNLLPWFAIVFCVSSRADSWMPASEFDVVSENKKFVARVVPAKKDAKALLTVSSIHEGHTNNLWKAELSNRASPTQAYVSDDGEAVVTLDNWFGVGYGDDVVAVYSRGGQLSKYSLEQFAPPPTDPQSGGLSVGVHGGYENKFTHTTSSRHWRKNSIQFFSREAGQWLFCLWLDWDTRWVAWRMADGKLIKVTETQARRFNSEGRRRALNQAARDHSSAAMNFLGRMRFKEDRPLVEAWLQDTEFSGGSMQSYASEEASGVYSFTARSYKRESADQILARWDGRDSGSAEFDGRDSYQFLGTLKCVVSFAVAPEKKDGVIRLYLIPASTSLKDWAVKPPAHYLTADLNGSYPYIFENGQVKDGKLLTDVNFTIYGVTPGTYRLKAVWDKVPPVATDIDIVCQPSPGDYESTTSPSFTIRKGMETEGVRIECKTLVVE